jgi:transcriptional regulator with XRE-family HTH domain
MKEYFIETVLTPEGKQRLAKIIKNMMGEQTQTEFATFTGISQSTISNYLRGIGEPGLEHIEILATINKMQPEDFIAYIYGRHKNPLPKTRKAEDLIPCIEQLDLQEKNRLIKFLLQLD